MSQKPGLIKPKRKRSRLITFHVINTSQPELIGNDREKNKQHRKTHVTGHHRKRESSFVTQYSSHVHFTDGFHAQNCKIMVPQNLIQRQDVFLIIFFFGQRFSKRLIRNPLTYIHLLVITLLQLSLLCVCHVY